MAREANFEKKSVTKSDESGHHICIYEYSPRVASTSTAYACPFNLQPRSTGRANSIGAPWGLLLWFATYISRCKLVDLIRVKGTLRCKKLNAGKVNVVGVNCF